MTVTNLRREDWNFAAVPDDELFACLVYEYGRESRSFMYHQELSDAEEKVRPDRLDYEAFHKAGYRGRIPRIANTPEEQAIAKESLAYIRQVAKFDAEAFLQAFWNCDQGFIEIFGIARRNASPYSLSWLLYPDDLRKEMGRKAKDSCIFGPLKEALLGDLETLWNENAKELCRLRETPALQKYGDEVECELFTETTAVFSKFGDKNDEAGELIAAFAIDVRRYSNAQILEAFKKWLGRNRPKDIAEPIQRGKKQADARAALEWLGTMRALHYYSWRDPRFPAPLKMRGELGCYKARKRAHLKFHELFPFLPVNEDPYSWPTAAQRRRRETAQNLTGSI